MKTWYILEDGCPGDPALIAPGDNGLLRHADGRAVAYGPHGPRSRGMTDSDIAVWAEKPKRTYKTREARAE
jgi:hypothetical protein